MAVTSSAPGLRLAAHCMCAFSSMPLPRWTCHLETVHLHPSTGAASRALRNAARSVDKFTREHCGECPQGHAALEVAAMLFDLFV